MAGEQRTTPSSPCAIQLIASRGVSLSAFSCAGPPSSGRTAYGRPAQCTCPPPFAASRPHLRNRGEAIGRSRSTAAAVASEEIVGARSVTKCGGRKSHDQRRKSRSKYSIFFGHFSRRCQLRTSRTCSKVNSRYVVATFHSSIHPRPTHCARGSRQTRGRCDSERWAPGLSSPVCCDMLKGVPNLCLNRGCPLNNTGVISQSPLGYRGCGYCTL